jgi:hypothetical protein
MKNSETVIEGSAVLYWGTFTNRFTKRPALFHGVFDLHNHFSDHLAADGTGLLRGQIAVITLLDGNANVGSGFHLKSIQSGTRFGNEIPCHFYVTLLFN